MDAYTHCKRRNQPQLVKNTEKFIPWETRKFPSAIENEKHSRGLDDRGSRSSKDAFVMILDMTKQAPYRQSANENRANAPHLAQHTNRAPYRQSAHEVIKFWKSNETHGLSSMTVKEYREKYGLNQLEEKKKISPIVLFIRQFKSFIIYILIFALALSLLAKEYVDASVISCILVLNALLGFIQEYKAEKAIAALKRLAGLTATVIRDGKQQIINASELLPGDIIILDEGNRIPADARILQSFGLHVSEASLTGESLPVSKHSAALNRDVPLADRSNMVFSGTVVTSGRATAIITGTGMHTEIGKIAKMITEVVEEETPLQKNLEAFGKRIGIATLVVCLIIFLIGVTEEGLWPHLFSGDFSFFLLGTKEWLLVAVSLAVAAVPEGLPAVVTIALAIGVVKMVKRNALIRKLPSVETLGSTTIICTDKTGTLTKNEMTVTHAATIDHELTFSGTGYNPEGSIKTSDRHPLTLTDEMLLTTGLLCNNATLHKQEEHSTITGDPTEAALLVSAIKAGFDDEKMRALWPRINEVPFDSDRKMMSTINTNQKTGKTLVFTKGAPERVLEKCDRIMINGRIRPLNSNDRKKILAQNIEYAKQALRVLGFAFKPQTGHTKIEDKLIFLGLQGMIDPPHAEVKGAIAQCTQAGIRVIMLTGDQQPTAVAVAQQIGLTGKAMDGSEFARLSEEQQIEILKTTSIFTRVEPRHKMIMVQLLQKQGEIVAMTGDGVNDAPAIKQANLGIAMGIAGTDVTKESSAMVLLDDNFTTIVAAVEEGRGIYENIRKFTNYLLSCNFAEVLIILAALLLQWPLPLTAVMLLWLNLVTDGLPALALSVDPNPKNLMQQPPRRSSENLLNKEMMINIAIVSGIITLGVLMLFWWGMQTYAHLPKLELIMKIQTLAFTGLITMELARLQSIRAEYKLGIFSNLWLVWAVITSIALQLLVIYTPLARFFETSPLNSSDWTAILIITVIVFALTMGQRALRRIYQNRKIKKTN